MRLQHFSQNRFLTDVLRGVIIAIACTAGGIVLFALLLALLSLGDGLIRTINQLIKLLSVGAGVFAAVKPASPNGLARGALIGALYMGVGVAVYAVLTGQGVTAFALLADVLLGVAAGGLLGLLRSR